MRSQRPKTAERVARKHRISIKLPTQAPEVVAEIAIVVRVAPGFMHSLVLIAQSSVELAQQIHAQKKEDETP